MSSGLTLYGISDDLVALFETYDMCETDEARAECEAEIRKTIEAQIRKVDNFNRFFSHVQSQRDLATKEIERLKARKAAFMNLEERLEQYAIRVMQSLGLRKLDGQTSKLTLRTNQPAVEVDDEELVPAEYKTIKQTITVDKRAIKSAIDAGEEVPGVHLREPSISLLRT
jgi:hypothetical protein